MKKSLRKYIWIFVTLLFTIQTYAAVVPDSSDKKKQ